MSAPQTGPTAALGASVRRAILGLGVSQIIGWGTTYYLLSFLGAFIGPDLGLTKPEVVAGVSFTLVGSALLGPIVGRWQDRAGSRIVMATGSLVMAAGLLALAQARGPVAYYAAWIIIGIGTPMALYSAAFTALTQIAGQQARRAIIYLTFMGGLASTISWPATAAMIGVLDWRGIVTVFGVLNLVICLPIHLALMPSGIRSRDGAAGPEVVAPGLPSGAIAPAFLLLAGMLAINSFIFNAWSLLVFPVLDGLGFAPGVAVTVASAVGICQVLGRMGEMALGGRYSAFWTGLVSVALLPVSFIILVISQGGLGIGLVFALFYGISNGLVTIARGALTLVIFGARGYGERFGKVTFASGLMGALAPILGGLAIEAFGAMALIGILLLTSCVSLMLMLLLIRHCRRNGLA